MSRPDFDRKQFAYPLEEIARSITILPGDDDANIAMKRAGRYVVEGQPEVVARQLQISIINRGFQETRQELLNKESFPRLVLLLAAGHPILRRLEYDEREVRLSLFESAEVIAGEANLERAQRVTALMPNNRGADAMAVRDVRVFTVTLHTFQDRLIEPSFYIMAPIPPEY